jgi:hypothetical protein
MKKILYSAVLLVVVAACDTPNKTIGNPDPTTNTTGTTGSANMTNTPEPVIKTTPGTATDSAVNKKDTLPR